MVLLELAWRRSKQSTGLLASRPRRCKSQQLLDVLANGHGTQDVQEDEGTLSVVVPGQVAMAQSLDPGDGREWQPSHYTTVKATENQIVSYTSAQVPVVGCGNSKALLT